MDELKFGLKPVEEKPKPINNAIKKRKRKKLHAFNGLTPKEWTQLSRSVWLAKEVSSPRKWYHKEHGATFSEALAERAIKMYSNAGDLILDPFVGVGATLLAARNLQRKGIGIELYEKFVNITKNLLIQKTLFNGTDQEIIHGDCRDLLEWVEPNSVQLVFTSPPYANFIKQSLEDRRKTHKKSRIVIDNNSVVKEYGDSKLDFGNLTYDEFLIEIKSLMKNLLIATKPGGYNVWVIKDCRNCKNGIPFIDFHSDIGRLGREVGFLYHDLIVWDQNDQRRLVLLGYPSVFYVNINHTFLVILRKRKEK